MTMAFPLFSLSAPPTSLPKLMPLQVHRNQHLPIHAKCMATNQTRESMETMRRSANYQPSIWHNDFIQSIESDYKGEPYKSRAELLKQEIRNLLETTIEPLARLELIDKIQRLGLGYHFEREVKSALETILVNPDYSDDLYTTALRFRLLRKNGFKVTQDEFCKFKHGNQSFKTDLCGDMKVMQSLYEASHLGFEGETIMGEARAFTDHHLRAMLGELDNELAHVVKHSLELPLHMRMLRHEARWYIDVYEEEESMNPTLLELAKLDFNMVQAIHQSDLKTMSRWWIDIGLQEKLRFARDRLVENFFWTIGVTSDPQFSMCREGVTKVDSFITVIDDIYDVYGSLDELELFTDTIVRWDVRAIDQLPDYMKICFLAFYNTINELVDDTLNEKSCNAIQYLKKSWADMCKSFLVEAKWHYNGYIPTLEEYLENAWISSSGAVILYHTYFLMGQEITREALQQLDNYPKIVRYSSMILRLCNDLATSKVEQERGDVAGSIHCYMKQAGVSEEIACRHIRDLISSAWMELNAECDNSSSYFCRPFIDACLNLARMSQYVYQYGDGHSTPNKESKEGTIKLLVESVRL